MSNRLDLAPGVIEALEAKHTPEKLDMLPRQQQHSLPAPPSPPQSPEIQPLARKRPPRIVREPSLEEQEGPERTKRVESIRSVITGYLKFTCLLVYVFVFVFVTATLATHMLYNGDSLIQAAERIVFIGNKQAGTTTTLNKPLYPLWVAQHDTKSAELDLALPHAKPLVSSLEQSFRLHMEMSTQYACLCMHHLSLPPAVPLAQVCGIYNRPRGELCLMINPSLRGYSNQTDYYGETSVACKKQKASSKRHRHIFLEWVDPNTRSVLYSKFTGMEAVCMQLALDEIKGDKHCA